MTGALKTGKFSRHIQGEFHWMGIHEIILALIQEPLETREKPGEDPPRTMRSTGLKEAWACKNKFFLFKSPSPWSCLPVSASRSQRTAESWSASAHSFVVLASFQQIRRKRQLLIQQSKIGFKGKIRYLYSLDLALIWCCMDHHIPHICVCNLRILVKIFQHILLTLS